MRMPLLFALAASLLITAPSLGQGQAPQGPKEVTTSAIAGIVTAGAKWKRVWDGPDTADGIVGTPDGGVIFAQREVSRVRKIDVNGKSSVIIENTDGAGA